MERLTSVTISSVIFLGTYEIKMFFGFDLTEIFLLPLTTTAIVWIKLIYLFRFGILYGDNIVSGVKAGLR